MTKSKRIFITVIVIVVAVVFLIVAGSFLFSHLAKKNIRGLKFASLELNSQNIETNLFKRQIILKEAELKAPGSGNNVVIPNAKLTGIHLFHLIFSNEIVVNKFTVSGPTINFYKKDGGKSSSDTTGRKKNTVLIKHLEVPGLEFNLLTENDNKPDTTFTTVLDFDIWKLSTDSASAGKYSLGGVNFNRIEAMIKQGSYKMKNKLYRLSYKRIGFNSEEPDLTIAGLKMDSPHKKFEIGHVTGVQTDWLNINIDSLRLKNIDLKAALQDTAIIFGACSIKNFEVEVFRDKRLEFPQKPDTKLPMDMINNLPVAFHSDSIIIENGNIKYEEFAEGADEAGHITFNDLQASIVNLSNIDSLITGKTKLSAKANIMNQPTLNADFIFPNVKYDEPYQASGTLEPTQISIFNPMMHPSAGVKINSGHINQLAFDFSYNYSGSSGNLIFKYENLDFTMYNREDNSEKPIESFFVDAIAIRNSNTEGDSYQKGEISVERNVKKSVFNYWWKSLFSGIKSVVVVFK